MNHRTLEDIPFVVVAAAIIFRERKILITKRKFEAHQGGLWEFPGGKQEENETLEQCLKRELKEEIDIEVCNVQPFCVLRHRYSEKEVELHFFTCSIHTGNPQPVGCIEVAWAHPHELTSYEFPAADEAVLKKIIQGPLEHKLQA
ncbi:MAG: 8-oxo-dGTP diphosphatase MutT [Nitrospirales bacterium]